MQLCHSCRSPDLCSEFRKCLTAKAVANTASTKAMKEEALCSLKPHAGMMSQLLEASLQPGNPNSLAHRDGLSPSNRQAGFRLMYLYTRAWLPLLS